MYKLSGKKILGLFAGLFLLAHCRQIIRWFKGIPVRQLLQDSLMPLGDIPPPVRCLDLLLLFLLLLVIFIKYLFSKR